MTGGDLAIGGVLSWLAVGVVLRIWLPHTDRSLQPFNTGPSILWDVVCWPGFALTYWFW